MSAWPAVAQVRSGERPRARGCARLGAGGTGSAGQQRGCGQGVGEWEAVLPVACRHLARLLPCQGLRAVSQLWW